MASVNPLSRELVFKVVYYGPGLCGKTTTLEHIHATAKPDHRGKLVSLATPVDRTLYFDFLPMRLPPIRGMHVRLQLFTVPGQVYFNATRKLVLTGADGVVFVADAQTARADANLESLDNLRDNLADQGRNLNDVPLIFQYNKYDLPDVLSVDELDKLLNRWNAPSLATSARTGLGVYEGLEKITHAVLASFETQMPESVRVAAAAAYDPHEEGLAAALRGASQSEERPPTSGAIFNRVASASSRVTLGSIPPETGSEEAPPIDKAAMRAAALPVTTFPETSDDGWGPKEKLGIAPATDASILTRHEGRSHSSRGPDSRSGESPRSRNRPSVLPPKPYAPLIPQAGPPRSHAPAPPPNATISSAKEPTHMPVPHAPAPPPNATVTATSAKITAGADKAPSTEKTIALQAKPPTTAKAEPPRVEVAPAKPEPPKQQAPRVEVAPPKPEPPKQEAPKVEVAPAKPEPPKQEAPKVEVAPPKPEPPKQEAPKVEVAPPKPEPPKQEAPKVEVAPAIPERLDPTLLFSIADLLEPPPEPIPASKDDAQRAPPSSAHEKAPRSASESPSARTPSSASNALATLTESRKSDVPPPPPPPPARPIGAIATLHDVKVTESVATTSPSRESSETRTEVRRATGLSFAELWPEADRALVHDVEAAIAGGKLAEAIDLADGLVTRILTSTATLFGSTDTNRDASNMPYLLGIDGRRYLAFRSIVRASRSGAKVSAQDALGAYAFALEVRMAKSSVR